MTPPPPLHTQSQRSNSSSVFTESAGATVTGLRQNTEYGFQVRAQTEHGWGEFSRPLYTTAGRTTDSGEHGWGEFSRPIYWNVELLILK